MMGKATPPAGKANSSERGTEKGSPYRGKSSPGRGWYMIRVPRKAHLHIKHRRKVRSARAIGRRRKGLMYQSNLRSAFPKKFCSQDHSVGGWTQGESVAGNSVAILIGRSARSIFVFRKKDRSTWTSGKPRKSSDVHDRRGGRPAFQIEDGNWGGGKGRVFPKGVRESSSRRHWKRGSQWLSAEGLRFKRSRAREIGGGPSLILMKKTERNRLQTRG